MASLKTARDSLVIEVITEGEDLTDQLSRETLARTMPGRDNLCPAGGTVYLLPLENGAYDVVCGLHNSDTKQRTRLNATHAMEELQGKLILGRRQGEEVPETVTIELNGQELEILRTEEPAAIRRGTGTTDGYEGVVAFFAIEGLDGWQNTGAKTGDICYFLYADTEHCAVWNAADGWAGDSYAG